MPAVGNGRRQLGMTTEVRARRMAAGRRATCSSIIPSVAKYGDSHAACVIQERVGARAMCRSSDKPSARGVATMRRVNSSPPQREQHLVDREIWGESFFDEDVLPPRRRGQGQQSATPM